MNYETKRISLLSCSEKLPHNFPFLGTSEMYLAVAGAGTITFLRDVMSLFPPLRIPLPKRPTLISFIFLRESYAAAPEAKT